MVAPGALCVSLTPRSLDEVFSSDLTGADCAEVRLDYLDNPQESVHARWDRLPVPVIATCRGRERGGRFGGSVEEEISILQSAVENGAKFVDIDYRSARSFPGAQVIASFHDFEKTPADIDSVLDNACAGPGDIAKVATFVNAWADNQRLLSLLGRRWPKPVIVIGMGEVGQITRIIGPSRGSFLTYAAATNASAPGQLSVTEMLDIHRGIAGFSITAPYQTAVIPFLDGLTAAARKAGAANTVSLQDGKWIGDMIVEQKSGLA
jgi:3-dehydroquinate dehydratase type I